MDMAFLKAGPVLDNLKGATVSRVVAYSSKHKVASSSTEQDKSSKLLDDWSKVSRASQVRDCTSGGH